MNLFDKLSFNVKINTVNDVSSTNNSAICFEYEVIWIELLANIYN